MNLENRQTEIISCVAKDARCRVQYTKEDEDRNSENGRLNNSNIKQIKLKLFNALMPAVPNCCCSNGSAPYWFNTLFFLFLTFGCRRSTQMSKIKNGGLDQYGKV